MSDAEDAWFAKDFARARQCVQRILNVRPTHQAANERLAELFFIDGLQAEGLRHFDRLVQPPAFPIIDFRAAGACLITNRFEQGAALAKRFLHRTEDDGRMDDPRAKARLIHAECRRLANSNRGLARQPDRRTHLDERAAPDIRRQVRRLQPAHVVPGESAPAAAHAALGRRAPPPAPMEAVAAMAEPLPAPPPIPDLPTFPNFDVARRDQ